jgi:hypothetical protein
MSAGAIRFTPPSFQVPQTHAAVEHAVLRTPEVPAASEACPSVQDGYDVAGPQRSAAQPGDCFEDPNVHRIASRRTGLNGD